MHGLKQPPRTNMVRSHFWTVKIKRTAPFVEAVRKEAEEADVPLMLIDKSQARLTVKQIMQGKPEFVAFCGLALLQKAAAERKLFEKIS